VWGKRPEVVASLPIQIMNDKGRSHQQPKCRFLKARSVPLATPSPYSLQGTFEKIHFQGLICQQSLELGDLLAQDQFAGPYRMRVSLVHSVAPVVKYPAAYCELFCEPNNVATRIHSLDGLPPKLITAPLRFFRSTLRLLSRKVCIIKPFHSRRSLHSVHRKRSDPFPPPGPARVSQTSTVNAAPRRIVTITASLRRRRNQPLGTRAKLHLRGL
jgi:hypothetical protein